MSTYLEETEVSRGQSAQSDNHLCAKGVELLSSWEGGGDVCPSSSETWGWTRDRSRVKQSSYINVHLIISSKQLHTQKDCQKTFCQGVAGVPTENTR